MAAKRVGGITLNMDLFFVHIHISFVNDPFRFPVYTSFVCIFQIHNVNIHLKKSMCIALIYRSTLLPADRIISIKSDLFFFSMIIVQL